MSDLDAFVALEMAVLEVRSLGHVLVSVPPDCEVPFEHVQSLLGAASLRLTLAWDAYLSTRSLGGAA